MELLQVSFEPMNEVHNKEAEVLERLLIAIKNRENLDNVYDEFIKDVENHFSFEQKLMDEYEFFAKIPHKMEHNKILNELKKIKNHLNEYENLEKYFDTTFLPWLTNHIATMDTVTAGFFSQIGVKI